MSDMISKLPYTLTTGVIATREGLELTSELKNVITALGGTLTNYCSKRDRVGVCTKWETVWDWPDAAERLQYREGEPWCTDTVGGSIICPKGRAETDVERALHRLAAILCDDADAFRVLHWCIHNLPKETNNG